MPCPAAAEKINLLALALQQFRVAALRVSSEMLQRHATHPSEDLALYDDVRNRIVRREADDAAEAMTRLLKASLARVLPITTKI